MENRSNDTHGQDKQAETVGDHVENSFCLFDRKKGVLCFPDRDFSKIVETIKAIARPAGPDRAVDQACGFRSGLLLAPMSEAFPTPEYKPPVLEGQVREQRETRHAIEEKVKCAFMVRDVGLGARVEESGAALKKNIKKDIET